jgi:hypothetical protein
MCLCERCMVPVDDRARWLTKLDTCGVMICNPCWSRLIVASLIRKKREISLLTPSMLCLSVLLVYFSFHLISCYYLATVELECLRC